MHYRKDEKEMWLVNWKNSGKSAWVYAKENGLNQQTFINWTKAKTEAKPYFVEVPKQIIQQPLLSPEILIEKGDVKIHIPVTIGTGELRAVMEGLGASL